MQQVPIIEKDKGIALRQIYIKMASEITVENAKYVSVTDKVYGWLE